MSLLMVFAEFLACRDVEILLPHLLTPGPHQSRRIRPQHRGAPVKEGMKLLVLVMLFLCIIQVGQRQKATTWALFGIQEQDLEFGAYRGKAYYQNTTRLRILDY
jgi:hypothetical protein